MLSTRLLIIIVVVIIMLAIVSMVIGTKKHSSTSGSSVTPTDSSWKPAWMMSWMKAIKPASKFPLQRITVNKVVPAKGAIEIPAKATVTMMVAADASASNPQQVTLTLADHADTDTDTTELIAIEYLVTGGSPPASLDKMTPAAFPMKKNPDEPSQSSDKTGHKGAAPAAHQSSTDQPQPWQVQFAIYPARGGQITLISKVNQRLIVNVQ